MSNKKESAKQVLYGIGYNKKRVDSLSEEEMYSILEQLNYYWDGKYWVERVGFPHREI